MLRNQGPKNFLDVKIRGLFIVHLSLWNGASPAMTNEQSKMRMKPPDAPQLPSEDLRRSVLSLIQRAYRLSRACFNVAVEVSESSQSAPANRVSAARLFGLFSELSRYAVTSTRAPAGSATGFLKK